MLERKKSDSITLREYFDNRFQELRHYMDIKFEGIEKSTSLAQDNLNARLESMNEFRSSMKDQAANYVTRVEMSKYESDIRMLREALAESRGKASQWSVIIAYLFVAISLILSFSSLVSRFLF